MLAGYLKCIYLFKFSLHVNLRTYSYRVFIQSIHKLTDQTAKECKLHVKKQFWYSNVWLQMKSIFESQEMRRKERQAFHWYGIFEIFKWYTTKTNTGLSVPIK